MKLSPEEIEECFMGAYGQVRDQPPAHPITAAPGCSTPPLPFLRVVRQFAPKPGAAACFLGFGSIPS